MAAMSSFLRSEKASKLTGYSKKLFKEKVDIKYLCQHCNLVLRNPVQTGCGERFCRPCADDILRESSPSCPVCNEPLYAKQVFRDVFAEREVLALCVRCENHQTGCTWEGHLRDLDEHVESCDFAAFHCPNNGCQELLPKQKMAVHTRDECRFRYVSCQYCQLSVQFCDMDEHLHNSCNNKPKQCVQCQKTGIPNDQMDAHLDKECPKRLISCEFYAQGCRQQFYREELVRHNEEFALQHVSYIMPAFQEMKSIVSTLCRQVSSLEQKNVGLERELASVSAAQASSAASVASKGRRGVAGKASDNQSTSLPSAADSPSTDFADGMSADLSTKVSENSSKIRKNAGALIKHTSDIQSAQSSIESNSRSIGVQDVQLSDLSLRLDIVDVKTTNGVLVWKIGDISRRRREAISGKTPSLYSAPFYTSPCGYKMCARVYLDGDGMGKGGCISVFFVIMRGEYDALLLWPFQLRVTMMLIDQSDSVVKRNITEVFKPDGRSASFKRPKNEMNTGSGCPMFASVNVLDSPTYVKDDIIFIKVIADKASTHFVPPDHDRQ